MGANLGDEKRFWKKVDKTDINKCWNWKAYKDIDWGYGIFRFREKTQKAHRVSWIFSNGAIPEGLCVLHKCDNPACVNPSHLFLGTNADNVKDRNAKNRQSHNMGRKGIEHSQAKLCNEQVVDIRILYYAGIAQNEIAKMYNVSPMLINRIVHRKLWKHI